MQGSRVMLEKGEEVLFDRGPALLTSRRLMANWRRGREGAPQDQVDLKDVADVQRVVGGEESRLRTGLRWVAVGGALVLLEVLAGTRLGKLAETLVFLAGSLSLILGLYIVQKSLLRVKPHTTLFFLVPGAKDIRVSFPGRDNPEADELVRQFRRAKRRG